jgi:SPP1 gp7 family putative phage head morphogenesis protein
MITKERQQEINELVYLGIITPAAPPLDVYLDYGKTFEKALYRGWGKKLINMVRGTPEWNLVNALRNNLYIFSGAKDHKEIFAISKEVLRPDGSLKPFNEFIEKARSLNIEFKEQWLKVERDQAVRMAESSKKWQQIQKDKDLFPLLRYVTAGDQRVRPGHAILEGTIKPVDDPFWDSYMPPNGWGVCRCEALQETSGLITPNKDIDFKEVNKDVPELFRMNPGKHKFIFKPTGKGKHPYFSVSNTYKDDLKNNFGFPIPPPE